MEFLSECLVSFALQTLHCDERSEGLKVLRNEFSCVIKITRSLRISVRQVRRFINDKL